MIPGYKFNNTELCKQALTHKSAAALHNERLEFLGDALLGAIISELLYQAFPSADEGKLSRLRASIVNQQALAETARRLQLGEQLILGSGEQRAGGKDKDSLLSDALEALIAAVFLDGGMPACRQLVTDLFESSLGSLSLDREYKDAKSSLQEWLQARQMDLPVYQVDKEEGPDNARSFTVSCQLKQSELTATAVGSSKKQAEQAAAARLLAMLDDAELS